jgi:hypothetical protein
MQTRKNQRWKAGFKAVLVALAVTLAGCGGSSSKTPASGATLSSVLIAPVAPSLAVGSTKQFAATATYSDNSTKDVTASATWSSSNATVASVETAGQAAPGLATGMASGTATVSASFSGMMGSTTLTVTTSAVVTSVSMSPTAVTVGVGAATQFSAVAGYSDGSSKNVTALATWTSTDPTVVSIESTGQTAPGMAAAVSPGDVNITVSYGGVNAVTTLNVVTTTGNLTEFFITQLNPSIAPGATLQLFGNAIYSDGSNQWVTDTTHWTSSNPAVATIADQGAASPGLITAGPTTGTTTITGSFGGLQHTTTITVAANAVPIDLMDMAASDNYLHFQGGLYENSSDTVPSDHDAAGLAAASVTQPLDQNGNPSAAGAVVFLGIGMSNATEEFSAFINTASTSSAVNHATLAIENGASAAETACYWTVAQGQTGSACPLAKGGLLNNQYDRVRDSVLATATTAPSAPPGCGGPPATPCLTEKQVQVLWIKNANPRPGVENERALCDATVSGCVNDIGTEAINYEAQLAQTIRAAKSRYPNLKQVFLSTRIYAGYALDGLNPEPYAYEYGYSAKWLVQAQVLQIRNGTIDPIAGDMNYSNGTAAWTAWGTYLWADGLIPRSDNLIWVQSDFGLDGTHPDSQGVTKVVNLLMNFYTTSPYTPWFRP